MKCVYQSEEYNVYGEVYKVSERLAVIYGDMYPAREFAHIQGYEYEMFLDFGDGSGCAETWDSIDHVNGENDHLTAEDAQVAIDEIVKDCIAGNVSAWFTIH